MYIEDFASEKLYELNKDYIDLYYSKRIKKNKIIYCKNKFLLLKNMVKYKEFSYLLRIFNVINFNPKVLDNNLQIETVDRDLENKKVAIFTCVSGEYDKIKTPMYVSENCDYFLFTDKPLCDTGKWDVILLDCIDEIKEFSNLEKARFIKTHPHTLFQGYDYTIWVDGNMQIVCDLVPLLSFLGENVLAIHQHPKYDCCYQESKDVILLGKAKKSEIIKQLRIYEEEGFPKHYGLFETNVIVSNIKSNICKKIYDDWWLEIKKYTKRDQMSFTYVLWKNRLSKDNISLLGLNSKKNARFRFSRH